MQPLSISRAANAAAARAAARPRSARRAFSLLPLIIGTALAGILVVLAINVVLEGIQMRRENAIRENLQTVWVAANQYFIATKTEQVTLKELRETKVEVTGIRSLKSAANEDYLNVNEGTIRRDATELYLDYPKGKKTVRVSYKTPR